MELTVYYTSQLTDNLLYIFFSSIVEKYSCLQLYCLMISFI